MRLRVGVSVDSIILLLLAFTGFSVAVDNTTDIICLNGGSVIDGGCICAIQYTGVQCELDACLNGGKRLSGDGPCFCPWGLTGLQCETVTYCSETGTLQNGQCTCQQQWSGIFCNKRMCYNGVSVGNDGQCLCDLGFTGPFCDSIIACEHGNITETNDCQCSAGFRPPNCSVCEVGLTYSNEYDQCLLILSDDANANRSWFSMIPWWYFLIAALCILLLIVLIIATVLTNKYKKKNSRVGSAEPVINSVANEPPMNPQNNI